jgi:hypothetical protein
MKHEFDYTGFRKDQLEIMQTFYIAKLNRESPECVERDTMLMYANLGAVTLRLEALSSQIINLGGNACDKLYK